MIALELYKLSLSYRKALATYEELFPPPKPRVVAKQKSVVKKSIVYNAPHRRVIVDTTPENIVNDFYDGINDKINHKTPRKRSLYEDSEWEHDYSATKADQG